MGWREMEMARVAGAIMNTVLDNRQKGSTRTADAVLRELLDMPVDIRIALARELLEGTGRVVARDVAKEDDSRWVGGEMSLRESSAFAIGRMQGHNACRAAMLANDAGDG